MKVDWNKEKENIKNLIESNTPYVQIGKIYGVSISTIKKVAKKLNIPLKQRRKINPKETFNKGKKFKIRAICLNCGNELEKK